MRGKSGLILMAMSYWTMIVMTLMNTSVPNNALHQIILFIFKNHN